MVSRVRSSIVVSAVAVATTMLGAGCAASGPSGSHSTTNGSAPAVSANASAGTGLAAGCDSSAWQSAPVTVTHAAAVPQVPTVSAVRTAEHPECGYDRLVLDISGTMPSYSIRYVNQVIADPSGKPVTLPGVRYLLITLHSAQAHNATGAATISRAVQQPGYQALESWVVAGDFEGVVTLAVGLPTQVSIRTGELPGHLYVDFRR